MRAVRAPFVVVDPPVLCQYLSLEEAVEELAVQVLVAHAAVERLDPGVLPRRAGLDEDRRRRVEPAPVRDGMSDELRTIVKPEIHGIATLAGDLVQDCNDVIGVDRAVDHGGKCFPRELVDDVQNLDRPAVRGLVELEVGRPDDIRCDRAHLPDEHTESSEAFLSLFVRNSQPLFSPKTMDALVVDSPALLSSLARGASPAPAGTARRERSQPGAKGELVVGGNRGRETLCRSRLSDD